MLYHLSFPISPVILSQIRSSGLVRPVYSKHARAKASQNSINLPDLIDYSSCVPFELDCDREGRVIKVEYKSKYKGELNTDIKLDIKADKKVDSKLDIKGVIERDNNLDKIVDKTLDISKDQNANQIAS